MFAIDLLTTVGLQQSVHTSVVYLIEVFSAETTSLFARIRSVFAPGSHGTLRPRRTETAALPTCSPATPLPPHSRILPSWL